MAVTLTIGTASRMYTTWAAAEAAIPADISSSGTNTPYILEAYNDSEFTSSGTILTLSGITTDSTNTITCTCAPGQSWSDNPSRQTNRVDYNVANGVGLNASGFFSQPISCSVANVIFAGLQVTSNAYNNATLSTSGSVVQNCILKCASSGGSISPFRDNSGSNSKILNSVLINNNNAYGAFMVFGGLIANSTIVAPTGGSAGGVSVFNQYGTITVNNTALFGFGGAFGPGTYAGSNNCTDQTFAPGTSNLLSKTFANQFVHTADDGSLDLKLKTGADCIDAGFTDTADIPSATDAVGTSRPQGTAWDIGAWEFVIATGVTFPVTGAAGTSASGGITAKISSPIAGVSGTSAAGSISGKVSIAITGVSGTSGTVSIIGRVSSSIAGAAATSASGAITPSTSNSQVGVAANSSAGAVTGKVSVLVSGATCTSSAGTIIAAPSGVVSGGVATSSSGAITASINIAITGASSTSSAGSVSAGANTNVSVSGAAAASSVGIVAPLIGAQIAGAGAIGSAGSVVQDVVGVITGIAATSSAGAVSSSGSSGGSVAINGSIGTSSAGQISASIKVGISGVYGTTTAGQVYGSAAANDAGASSASAAGTIIAVAFCKVSGVTAVSAAGAVLAQVIEFPVGAYGTSQAGVVGMQFGTSAQVTGVLCAGYAGVVSGATPIIPLTPNCRYYYTGAARVRTYIGAPRTRISNG